MQHNSIQPTLQGEQHPTIPKSSMQQQSINKAQTSRFYLDVPSPLGTLRLESDGEALTALHFEDTKAVHTTTVAWHEAPQLPLFKEVQTWLARYFGVLLSAKVLTSLYELGLTLLTMYQPFLLPLFLLLN